MKNKIITTMSKIKMGLRALLPVRLRAQLSIKDNIRAVQQEKVEVKTNLPKIYIIGESCNGNVGDLAIDVMHIQMLRDTLGDKVEIISIHYHEFWEKYLWLKENVRKKDLITIPGGGNFGDIYLNAGLVHQAIFFSFPQNNIIVFPQTIHFLNKRSLILRNEKHLVRKNKKITICAREKFSFEKIKKYFPINKCLLIPDVVLGYQWNGIVFQRDKVYLCLRNDKEGIYTETDKRYIENICKQNGLDIKYTDTYIPDLYVQDIETKKQIFIHKLLEFSKAKIVITDRLHGMVFAYLSKTPCVVLKNFDHKIQGVYEWIKNVPFISSIDSLKDLEAALQEVQNADIIDSKFPIEKYIPLKKEVKKWYSNVVDVEEISNE